MLLLVFPDISSSVLLIEDDIRKETFLIFSNAILCYYGCLLVPSSVTATSFCALRD